MCSQIWCLHFTQFEKLIVDLATLQIIASPKEVEFESNSAKDSFEVNLGAEMAKLVALSLSQRKVLLSFLQKEISQRFVLWTLSLYFHSQYSFLQRSIQDYCFRKKLISLKLSFAVLPTLLTDSNLRTCQYVKSVSTYQFAPLQIQNASVRYILKEIALFLLFLLSLFCHTLKPSGKEKETSAWIE